MPDTTLTYAQACVLVDERSSRKCERCGRTILVGGSHHHRKLRSRGGTDSPANLVLLCGSGTTGCHGWVHANPASATEDGWMLGTKQDPESVAIDSARYGHVFLGVDGQTYGLTPDECMRADRAARLAATNWPSITTHQGIRA